MNTEQTETVETPKVERPKKAFINQYVRDENKKYVGVLCARKRNNGKILVTYSVCNDVDPFAKKQGTFIALQKNEWKMPETKKPDLAAKLQIIKQWTPKFVQSARDYFGVDVESPV